MAKNTAIVCKNHFQGECEKARLLAFQQKWLELVCRLEAAYPPLEIAYPPNERKSELTIDGKGP